MLLAAAIGDSKRFNAIWTWTQDNLRRPDGLFAFHWRNGHVVNPQAASDADLDASRALLVAACRFHQPHPARPGGGAGERDPARGGDLRSGPPVLTAGPWASVAPITVDPSYFSPATFVALRRRIGQRRMGSALAASSRSITSALTSPPARLPPDWARLEGDRASADRLAERSADAGHSSASTPSERWSGWPRIRTRRAGRSPPAHGRHSLARTRPSCPSNHTLSGRPIGDILNPVVLVAAAGAADAAGQPAARDGLLAAAEALDRRIADLLRRRLGGVGADHAHDEAARPDLLVTATRAERRYGGSPTAARPPRPEGRCGGTRIGRPWPSRASITSSSAAGTSWPPIAHEAAARH